MQVLEEILEEINLLDIIYDLDNGGCLLRHEDVEEIIRKYLSRENDSEITRSPRDTDVLIALEVLDKLSFFGGQRAGRELWNDKTREVQDEDIASFNRDIEWLREFIRKYINDGWIPVEDERLWDILFEEACVEGEQAKRIYNRLKETFGGERSEMDGKF